MAWLLSSKGQPSQFVLLSSQDWTSRLLSADALGEDLDGSLRFRDSLVAVLDFAVEKLNVRALTTSRAGSETSCRKRLSMPTHSAFLAAS
jgi:hypothetical protein